ncbi:MAG: methyltransferase domain-containing protein [Bacillota bacterium]|nr:MAG: methyltransferase [Bacillota bacterium]
MAHRFDPAKMERLLAPDRRQWLDPLRILGLLDLRVGMTLLDVGCGPGYFALEAARMVAPAGKVYGVDVSEEMVARLRERAAAAGVENLVPVLAEEEDEYPVPSASCDAALLVDVYHEVDPASGFLGEIRRILKPGAHVLVVDWKPEPTPLGPPLPERIAPDDVVEEMTWSGYEFLGPREVGPYHYGLLFRRP